ncbi:MAG: hypothetical protein MZV49_00190 [Rhodopseudomonas palustris]|nr:hypothetical protein [Rhodopseudomonas palustris]
MLFALIESGANNAPDYNKVRKLLFVRQGLRREGSARRAARQAGAARPGSGGSGQSGGLGAPPSMT